MKSKKENPRKVEAPLVFKKAHVDGRFKVKVCKGTLKIGEKFYKVVTLDDDREVLKTYENVIVIIRDSSVFAPDHINKGEFIGYLYEIPSNNRNVYYMGTN